MKELRGALRNLAAHVTFQQEGILGKQECSPIHCEGRPPTVLAVHGYCGVPREVAVVCEAAARLGLAAEAPLLAGHGTSARDLAPLSFADWVESLQGPFAKATARGPVVLAGLSLGSLLALSLALEQPDQVAGLVLLGNALWLAEPFPGMALRVVDALRLPDFGLPKVTSGISDAVARSNHTTYPTQPVHGAITLQKAAARLREQLGRITCPTLILHGAKDRTCPVSNAWRAAERLGSDDIQVRIFPRSAHVLTRDVEREQVRAAIEGFLRQRERALLGT